MIYLIHLLFVGPLLMYCGYIGTNISKKDSPENEAIFNLLFIIGLVVSIYHGYLYIKNYYRNI